MNISLQKKGDFILVELKSLMIVKTTTLIHLLPFEPGILVNKATFLLHGGSSNHSFIGHYGVNELDMFLNH